MVVRPQTRALSWGFQTAALVLRFGLYGFLGAVGAGVDCLAGGTWAGG